MIVMKVSLVRAIDLVMCMASVTTERKSNFEFLKMSLIKDI